MQVVMATAATSRPVHACARLSPTRIEEALTTAVGYLAQLLNVEVHKLTGPLTLITLHRSCRPVQAGEDAQAGPPELAVDRRCRESELPGDAMRSAAELTAQADDGLDHVLRQGMAAVVRAARAVLQPRHTFF